MYANVKTSILCSIMLPGDLQHPIEVELDYRNTCEDSQVHLSGEQGEEDGLESRR